MNIQIEYYNDMWQQIKNAAMTTINKNTGKYPSEQWKYSLLLSEHSPIRMGEFVIHLEAIPSYVSTHFARHHIGVNHYVSTQRTDRTSSDVVGNRLSPVNMTMHLNFQSIINISRKRLCQQADEQTRSIWIGVLEEISSYEPELYDICVPECIYRGNCYEVKPCGYAKTNHYKTCLNTYKGLATNE